MFKSRLFLVLFIFVSLVLVLGVYVPNQAAPVEAAGFRHRPQEYILPGENVFPEGIAYQPRTGRFFVSATGDGTIFRGHVRFEETEVFLPGGEDGRTTAIGLAVDRAGRLFVAGGGTGQAFVYDAFSGDLLGAFNNGKTNTFVNDVAVTRHGDAYFTDSFDPTLYRVSRDHTGNLQFEEWLDLAGTPIEYQNGFNLNGIVATPNGKYLIVVQSNTGKLFRITIATKEIAEIDLGGETVTSGDGLVLRGRTLYVVRNALYEIAEVRLSGRLTRGTLVSSTTDPSFIFPTTAAQARGRLLVVNSQFDQAEPQLPFTVSSIRLP